MAKNLAASIRYQVIDKCLRNTGRQYTIDDLREECGKALYEAINKADLPSERTLRKDISTMKNGVLGYFAPIINVRLDPKKPGYYKYSDPNFSIKKFSLNEKEVKALKECLQIIRPFSEFDFQDEAMKTIKKLMEEIRPELNHNEAPIIGFDRVVNSEGWKLISTMYKAIQEKQVLKFDFHPFRDEPIQYFEEVHPYYLHEYNNRWFLFALCKCQEEEYSIYKFGLERIQKISSCLDVPFIPNTLFSSTEFFKNKVGVSSAINKKDDTIEKVILSFPKNRGLYVVSKPIHPSQKVILETENEIRIQLEVIINFELVREIVSFMDAVTVLEPEQLRNKVHEKLVQSIKNYASEFPAKTFNDSRVMSPYIAPKENPSTENIPSPSSGPKENNFQKIDQELDTQIHKEILEKLENGLKDFYNKKDKKK